MTTFLVCAAICFAIQALSIWMIGRRLMWQGWLIFLLLWPISWLFMPPEELP
jgi:hypothetical protein